MHTNFWGWSISFLGVWEAAAFATRGKIPTVSKCVWRGLGHKAKPIVRILVIVYLLGAARHLLNNKTM